MTAACLPQNKKARPPLFPPGITNEHWWCWAQTAPPRYFWEKNFKQPHTPLTACPVCGNEINLERSSSIGKKGGFIRIVTWCTNYEELPDTVYYVSNDE